MKKFLILACFIAYASSLFALKQTLELAYTPTSGGKSYYRANGIMYYIDATHKTAETMKPSSGVSYDKQTITIPDTVVYKNINYIVTTIGSQTYLGGSSTKTIHLPSTIRSLQYDSFGTLSSITTFQCDATTPPDLAKSVNPIGKIAKRGTSCEVIVPCGSVSAYNEKWSIVKNQLVGSGSYTITFKDYDGTTLQTKTKIGCGVTPTYTGSTPTRASTAQYTYTFKGWTPTIVAATANATYTATYTSTVRKYAIIFTNYDGTVLQNTQVSYGSTPEYNGATPTKPATAQYTYSFKGWDPAVVAVTGNATYTAQFDSVVNNYTIAFNNYNGAELQSGSVAYGQTPAYNGDTPTKPATAKYTYTFKGWDPEIVAVTGNATYTAQFDSVVNSYTIAFNNYNGAELQSSSVAYGQTPEYNGSTPTKPATEKYTYTFKGWDPEIAAVTGNATYTAQFDSTLIEYEIDTNPGSEPIEGGSVHIDGTPNYGETITLTPIEEDGYVFVEWSDGNNDNPRDIVVGGDSTIYPIFHKCEEIIFNIAHTIYKGSSYSFGGKELTVKGLYYDTIPLANGCDSVVELKLSVVKAPNFTLRVVVNDETMGTVTGTGSYKAGTSVTITATPASSKYIFVRWYNEDENIDVYENPYTFTLNRNLQLRAVFRKAPRKAPKSTNQTK